MFMFIVAAVGGGAPSAEPRAAVLARRLALALWVIGGAAPWVDLAATAAAAAAIRTRAAAAALSRAPIGSSLRSEDVGELPDLGVNA